MQAFDRGLPLPEERVALMFDLGAPAVEVGVAELADDAQVCNCNGVSKAHAGRPAWPAASRRSPGVVDQDQGRQGLRHRARNLVAQIVEWAAGGAIDRGPVGVLVRPGRADAQAGR